MDDNEVVETFKQAFTEPDSGQIKQYKSIQLIIYFIFIQMES